MIRAICIAVMVSGWLGSAAVARAQTACVEGRVAVDHGYCCWPGQHATEAGACLGPPECPGALVASGAQCVVRLSAEPEETTGRLVDTGPRREVDTELLGWGIGLIVVGWLGGGITETGSGVRGPYVGYAGYEDRLVEHLPAWPFGWIPVLHPLAAIGAGGFEAFVAGLVGSVGALMEIGGVVMAVLGQLGHEVPEAGTDPVALRIGAPGAEGGLSLEVQF